ncbi:DNA-binding protein [Aquamicrobium soli]|uniref:DNA-binding protein n=1 Tax=Aquamicrobium soli TaxID=1811518 RepID=A0ABV7KD00_9HYPH
MTIDEALSRPTISVPDAGKLFFGLARNAAYEAARSGDIPTIKIGGRIMVPVVPLAEKLGLRATIGRAA